MAHGTVWSFSPEMISSGPRSGRPVSTLASVHGFRLAVAAWNQGIDATFFRIPRAALALPETTVRDASAVRIGAGNPLAALTSQYLARLADDPVILGGGHGAALTVPTIELIRATLTVQTGDDRHGREPLDGTRPARILADMRTHLGDPGLSPAEVAARHHISVRYLHRLLQREGLRFGEWVRRNRLESTRRELADPARTTTPVAAIARRWGFTDAAHFSKAFRAAYGLSPRDWRALHATSSGSTAPSRRSAGPA